MRYFIYSRYSRLRWPAVSKSEAMFFDWIDKCIVGGAYNVTLEEVR